MNLRRTLFGAAAVALLTPLAFPQGTHAATTTFTSGGPIAIGGFGPANPYPSTITVPVGTGTITDVDVTLNGLNHTFLRDLDVLVVGPDGTAVEIMSDVGGGGSVSTLDLTFDDEAAGTINPNVPPASGSYQPFDNVDPISGPEPDNYPAPGPGSGPFASALAAFDGMVADGDWHLFIVDDFNFDSGTVASWSLTIEATQPETALLRISDKAKAERDSGTHMLNFTISLTEPASIPVTVFWRTSNGTATAGTDYKAKTGQVTFAPGVTRQSVKIPIFGDTDVEPDEVFDVTIQSLTDGVGVLDDRGVGTIRNDD